MRIELAISLRYLRSPRSDGAISFITWIALVGVMLGVGALVVAMAIMNGYQANLVQAMAGSLPHVAVNPLKASGLEDQQQLLETLGQSVPVVAASPFVMRETLVKAAKGTSGAIQGVMLRGIATEQEAKVSNFVTFVDDGSPGWKKLPAEERQRRAEALLRDFSTQGGRKAAPVLLSRLLAGKLGVGLGERLTLMKFPEPGAGFSPQRVPRELVVAGFFETGLTVFDELMLVTHIDFVPELLPDPRVGASLGIRLKDPMSAGRAADVLRDQSKIGDEFFYVYSWIESNQGIFQVLRLQKVMLFLVLMLIVIIAFFGMVSSLTMLVVEKTKEIAILKSLGVSERSIRLMFMLQGLFIGAMGTVLGVGLGLGVSFVLDTFPLIEIPPGVYPGTDRIPVLVAWQDVLWVVGGTMAVCLGATLVPAHKAVALRPSEGLRYG